MDSASTLSKHNSAVYESADVAAINQAIGAYNDQKPNLMKSMYPPNPVIESVEDDDGEGSATSEPMSPESQAMHDRNVEAAQELEMSPSLPGDDFSKFQRNVDPNMNGYKIVFMRNRPQKIHEYSEDYVTKRNHLTTFRPFPGCEARVRCLALDPIRFECCEQMAEPKACEIVLIDKP